MKKPITIIKDGKKILKKEYILYSYPFSSHLFLIDNELYLKENKTYIHINKIKDIVENGFKDKLTNCYTKNYLYKYLNLLIKSNTNFTLIFGDIDNFKDINKIVGHFKADKILRTLGQTFKKYLSISDYVFRFGGDEFFIVSKNCDLQEQFNFYKNINKKFFKLSNVTCSFGIISYDKTLSVEENLNKLDKILYESKLNGKNCILIGD